MPRAMVKLPGEPITREQYFADYDRHFWQSGGCWKLERQQHFVETDSPSWAAFDRGDWAEALRLLESRRPHHREYENRIAEHGFAVRRVRVAEEPLSPYLLWELNSLAIRYQEGGSIRIVGPHQIAEEEHGGVLPELFSLGDQRLYQVLYDDDGAFEGAIRVTDPHTVGHWLTITKKLYARGEELGTYFAREVAGRRPPGAR